MTFVEIANPDTPTVQKALAWSCDLCQAPKGQPCTNTIQPGQPLPGRTVHYARLVDRRKEPKDVDA